jgi:hypothetical protein
LIHEHQTAIARSYARVRASLNDARVRLALAAGALSVLTIAILRDAPIPRADALWIPPGSIIAESGAKPDIKVLPDADRDGGPEAGHQHLPLIAPRLPAMRKRQIAARSGIIKSRNGASARVAPRHAAKFQCLVDWLDEQGFRIAAMTGFAQRPYGGSLHPIGGAIDIDQAGRNYLTRGKRYPEGVNDAASRCGLLHGDRTAWPRYPDYGHFQVAGVSRGLHRRRMHQPQPLFAMQTQQQQPAQAQPIAQTRHRVRHARAIGQMTGNGAQDVR